MMPEELDYQKNIDILLKNKLINFEEIYDFHELPRADVFQRAFNFFQGNIFKHYNYGISPGLFYFNPETSVNARAGKINNYYLISINKGTIFRLLKTYNDNALILEIPELNFLKKLEKKTSNPINELMFQICCNFTFYHELAHLIQKTETQKFNMSEDISNFESFNVNNHILEYDADLFSAICIGTHLYQYINKYCPKANNKESEKIISIIGAGIFNYLLIFKSTKAPFYLRENSHPHPIVRIICIIYFITDYIEFVSNKRSDIILNKEGIISNIILYAKYIADYFIPDETMKHINKIFVEDKEKAVIYSQELFSLVKDFRFSAYNKRNAILMK